MKRGSIFFLRGVLVFVGIGVLAGLLREPLSEGRNVNADLVTVYFRDPFLAYVYVGSLPFFFGLYQAFNLLGAVGRGQAFSPEAGTALRTIKYCALAVIGFIVGADLFILRMHAADDDPAGFIALSIVLSFACLVAAAAAAVLVRVVQSAADLQSEHDLTV
jgi:hypothetical protein